MVSQKRASDATTPSLDSGDSLTPDDDRLKSDDDRAFCASFRAVSTSPIAIMFIFVYVSDTLSSPTATYSIVLAAAYTWLVPYRSSSRQVFLPTLFVEDIDRRVS